MAYLTDTDLTIVYNYKDGQERMSLADLPFPDEKTTLSDSSDNVDLGGA